MKKDNLKIIVLDNALELGCKVNNCLKKIRKSKKDYIIPFTNSRFSNGEGKIKLEECINDKDLYIISDVGNYGLTYKIHGYEHIVSPDEHFQDIKRVISATNGNASKITVIMPLLYQSRQHRRNLRESLDCALALQELESLGVNSIITFDVHDANVSNAIPKTPFENIYPTNVIIKDLIKNEKILNNELIIISPDFGAMERAKYYAEILKSNVGVFYKRRDLTKLINGKNPIVEHMYIGESVLNKNVIIVDDMIASGNSIIDSAKKLKEMGAKKIYIIATFVLLTAGEKNLIDAYKNNLFEKLYTTNLSYIPENIKNNDWINVVDCSSQLAKIINNLNLGESIEKISYGNENLIKEIERKKDK